MRLHDALLEQARHLVRRETRRPKQVSLRRAISTAYYALFHLLVFEAARIFVGSIKDPKLQARIQRSFAHRQVKDVSRTFTFPPPTTRSQLPRLPAEVDEFVRSIADPPQDLIIVARAFVGLYDARQEADYDIERRYQRQEAVDLVASAEQAFQAWNRVRSDPVARVYLISLLLATKWDVKRDV
jgi:uncharacterized protein (UPF0332 family)